VRGISTGSIRRRNEARVFDAQDWMHASGSAMRHHIDEPQAGKNQQGHENQGNRIHDHNHRCFPGVRISRGLGLVSSLARNE
jgi:hypothetical protein